MIDVDDDWLLEQSLRRSRRRRQRMATFMVGILVLPIVGQLLFVSTGLASRFGLMVLALPAAVLALVINSRQRPRR